MKKKILTILGTRPEIIRLSCVIKKIDNYFANILVNTNQNYDKNLNLVFFKELNLSPPKYNFPKKKFLNSINFISNTLIQIDKILAFEKPDAVLVLGDTNTALSVLCAKKRNIPIFHIEAGNRCYDQRVPEEINRVLVDKISDINLVYSDVAKQNLIKENFDLDKIIKIGSPLFEVFKENQVRIENSNILKKLNLTEKKYILLSCHREENVDKFNLKIIFSIHPRTKDKIKKANKSMLKNIIHHKPFGFFDYIKLQMNSKLTISDSGSIVEESNILNFAAINIRETTERQEGMEKGFAVLSGLKINDIVSSAEIVLKRFSNKPRLDIHKDYFEEHVSDKVINAIQSYIPYINRKVWFKY